MKHIFFCLLITTNLFSRPIKSTSNCGFDINKNIALSVAETFYNKLEVSTRLPLFTNRYIDRKSIDRTEVPASVWQSIKNSLDYKGFKDLAIQVLNNNFTTAEMQEMIIEYENNSYIPILHLKVRNELQLALQEFNVDLIGQINSILTNNNYQPIE